MKKLVPIFFALLLFSCSATSVKEEKNAPIDDYLETQDLNNEKIMIIREKINNNMAINIFNGKIYFEPLTEKYERFEGVQEPLYNKELWEQMKSKYENKSSTEDWVKESRWTRKDFRYKNIFFFKKEKMPKPWKNEQFKFDGYYTIFTFSEPIYYDEKYAVFATMRTTTNAKVFEGRRIIIMEKNNGKWVKVKEVGGSFYE